MSAGRQWHKNGQLCSMRRACKLSIVLFALIIISIVACRDGGKMHYNTMSLTTPAAFRKASNVSPPTDKIQSRVARAFSNGYTKKINIIPDRHSNATPVPKLELNVSSNTVHYSPRNYTDISTLSCEGVENSDYGDGGDFGLPPSTPMWAHPYRSLRTLSIGELSGEDLTLYRPITLLLTNPEWPERVALPSNDTAWVAGYLTVYANNVLEFEMHNQSHAGLGFDTALFRALETSTCIPAQDVKGHNISIRVPYRCVFLPRTISSINRTRVVIGRIRDEVIE